MVFLGRGWAQDDGTDFVWNAFINPSFFFSLTLGQTLVVSKEQNLVWNSNPLLEIRHKISTQTWFDDRDGLRNCSLFSMNFWIKFVFSFWLPDLEHSLNFYTQLTPTWQNYNLVLHRASWAASQRRWGLNKINGPIWTMDWVECFDKGEVSEHCSRPFACGEPIIKTGHARTWPIIASLSLWRNENQDIHSCASEKSCVDALFGCVARL